MKKALAIGGPMDGKMVEFEGTFFRSLERIPLPGVMGPLQSQVSVGWYHYRVETFHVGDRVDYFGINESAPAANIIQALIDAYVKSR